MKKGISLPLKLRQKYFLREFNFPYWPQIPEDIDLKQTFSKVKKICKTRRGLRLE